VATALPYNDEEPLQIVMKLSRKIASLGASLQSQLNRVLRRIRTVTGKEGEAGIGSDSEGRSNNP